MLYLTKIEVSLNEAARNRIRDAYSWHRMLWQAFPGASGQRRDFLFRVDNQGAAFRVLLLSGRRPDPPHWGSWQTKPVAESFLEHRAYRFQLRANPTMRRASDKRRLAIYHQERLRKWMARKAESSGFAIVDGSLAVGAPIDQYFIRNGRRGKHVSVEFSGALEVSQRPLFRQAFARGIGSAKAFGFGLLMLQPIG